MKMRSLVFALAAFASLATMACDSSNPNVPSTSFTAPTAAVPANGTTYKFKQQPIVLTLTNATVAGTAAVTYNVEVSTSSTFATSTQTQQGVAQGAGTSTTVTLSSLTGGATYYWRSRTVVDGIVGEASPTQSFVVQAPIVLGIPDVEQPAPSSTVSSPRPTFQVRNGARSGPVGAITYEFEVSTVATFASTVVKVAGIAEATTRTTWTPASDLPTANLFWRARAVDVANGEVGAYTAAVPFTVTPFDLSKAIFHNNGSGGDDIRTFPEGAAITLVDFSQGKVVVDFDRRTGPGRWPDIRPIGFDDDLQYTLGMCLKISGDWHCSAAIQFWFGRELTEGGDADKIGEDWFYDPRWGIMSGYQPRNGELVGIFAVAGNHRDTVTYQVKARTNILLIPFGQDYRK